MVGVVWVSPTLYITLCESLLQKFSVNMVKCGAILSYYKQFYHQFHLTKAIDIFVVLEDIFTHDYHNFLISLD